MNFLEKIKGFGNIDKDKNILMNLKFSENGNEYQNKINVINEIISLGRKRIKINTNKLDLEYDKKDQRNIRTIKNVSLYFEKENGKCVELRGNLGCSYTNPFGGEFFLKKLWDNDKQLYKNIRAPEIEIDFSNYLNITKNEDMWDILKRLKEMDNFEYNISQFNDFMNIFKYYKQLYS